MIDFVLNANRFDPAEVLHQNLSGEIPPPYGDTVKPFDIPAVVRNAHTAFAACDFSILSHQNRIDHDPEPSPLNAA